MLDTELDVLPDLIAKSAERLPNIDDSAFGAAFDRFGDARVVLLGEASHGTSEFYRARAEISRRLIERHGFTIVEGDGTRGCPDQAPFDAILAAASGSHVPPPLVEQLAPDGRLVMPLGNPGSVQELVKVTRASDGSLSHESLGAVRFVPLIGEEGWSDARH